MRVNRRFTNSLATRAPSTPRTFDEIVRELKLVPEEYASSAQLFPCASTSANHFSSPVWPVVPLEKQCICFPRRLHLSLRGILLQSKRHLAFVQMVRILIADDSEPVRRGIQTLLASRDGWFVCGEAADGLQAVDQAKSLRPDLIIMDVSMPNMNGLDAAETILREVDESRVLIISQNDPEIVRRQAVQARAHGFLEKSNIQRNLIAAVEGILLRHGQSETEKAG